MGKKEIYPIVLGIFILGLMRGPALGSEPIRIGYLQSDIHQLACWVALEKGFYKKQGVDVKLAGIFRAGPEEMSAFAAGALDMGYVGEAPATTAVANGMARVRILAQVNTEGSAIVVREKANIKTMNDLRGKRVAVPGHSTVQDFLLRKAMAKWNIPMNEINITVLKPPEMINALRTKQIDAFIAWEPYPAKAQTMGVGRVLLYSSDIWKNHPCCVLVADQRFLASRPAEARRMVAAHVEATDFIDNNPEEAGRIAVKYTGMDPESVRLAMQNVNYTYQLSIEGEKEYVRFLVGLKYIHVKDIDAFTRNFICQDILKELVKK
ncbi:MAG: nitrate ABC transporter substrate-binding protein [Deltaproteobacteria bacterium]|nr:MAG: nitrate ABC transporter substrate-binding protein [Deltaproteobacteria bacterium]